MKAYAFRPLCILAGILSAGAGCSVPRELTWLPDSSPRFCTRQAKGAVQCYNIRKHSLLTICGAGANGPSRIAVSPDGKNIAVIRAYHNVGEDDVTLSFYDLPSGMSHGEKSVVWAAENGKVQHQTCESGAYWSPDGKRILVYYASSYVGTFRYAVFDTEKRTLRRVIGTDPAMGMCWLFGVSPIRPDGAGYLAAPLLRPSELYFVDWEGGERKLSPTAELLQPIRAMTDSGKQDTPHGFVARLRRDNLLPLPHGQWDHDILVLLFERGELRCDTTTGRITGVVAPTQVAEQAAIARNSILDAATFRRGTCQVQCRVTSDEEPLTFAIDVVETPGNRKRPLMEGLTHCFAHPWCSPPMGNMSWSTVQKWANAALLLLTGKAR